MPLAIIAGMPVGKAREFESRIDHKAAHEGWSLAWVHARKDQPELRHCWHEVEKIVGDADEDGVHILAYAKGKEERRRYEKEVRFRHRLIWLDHSNLYSYPEEAWWLEIEERLRLESAWRTDVRPPNQHHALVLPSGTFVSARDPWTKAQRAQTDAELDQVRAEIRMFSERHRYQGFWRDDNSLLFDSGGAQHGQAPSGRRWKFTHQLPAGFHFDVQHEDGRSFSFMDADRIRQTFRDYANVDAHGNVRPRH